MAIAVANAYTSPQKSVLVQRGNKGTSDSIETGNPGKKKSLKASTKDTNSEKGNGAEQEFFWTYTEEPHRTRRQAIIKAHPEVRLQFLQ